MNILAVTYYSLILTAGKMERLFLKGAEKAESPFIIMTVYMIYDGLNVC